MANSKQCVGIVFQTSDNAYVKTSNNEPKQCVNPARAQAK